MKEKNLLSNLEWEELNRVVSLYIHFIASGAQIPMLLLVKERTLSFRKFEEMMRPKFFIDGFLAIGSVGCGVKYRSHEYVLRQDLIDRAVLLWKVRTSNRPTFGGVGGTVRINSWGILQFAMQAIAEKLEIGSFDINGAPLRRLESIRNLFSKIDKIWGDKRWAKRSVTLSGGKKVKLEESIRAGKEKNERSKRKRIAKQSAILFRPSWVLPTMKDFCDEYGQKMNLHWTGKDWGSARNFVEYCLRANEDPRELLRQIVQSWPRLFEGAIISVKTGRPIRFSKSVDFGQFFQFRQEVLDWMRQGGSDRSKREYIKKEVNLRKGVN